MGMLDLPCYESSFHLKLNPLPHGPGPGHLMSPATHGKPTVGFDNAVMRIERDLNEVVISTPLFERAGLWCANEDGFCRFARLTKQA